MTAPSARREREKMIKRNFANSLASSARREKFLVERPLATDAVDFLSNSDPPAKEELIRG